ncbi:MAG: hypothetical protein ACYSWO_09390 [Planctomycetota bacterium]|jgi:hypothetical protein
MKPIAKQLLIATFILALVTVASLGIRQVRFSASRAKSVKSPVVAETQPDPLPDESPAVDPELKPQYAEMTEPQEQAPSEEYAKAKGSKGGLEKISWGDNENLYITAQGETWYVGKGPDGKTTKMRVEYDQATGEITAVEGAEKSGGAQKISMGENEDVYITQDGQTWYVTEGSKARVEIDETNGEITVIERYGTGDGK